MALNEGWYFEGPDPEVGIFGDLIVHDACTAVPEGDDVPQAEQADVTTAPSVGRPGLVDITTTFRCPACGATTTTVDQQPGDYFQPDEEH